MKHVGMIKNTGKKCVVVFREIYNENGEVIQPDKCLVVELENLPDYAYQDMINIVESEPAQRTGNLYEVLSRTRLSDGNVALNWLHNNNRLRKYDTSNVSMIPSNNMKIDLDKLNRIIELQKQGYSEKDINNMLTNDTDLPPRESSVNTSTDTTNTVVQQDGVLSDEDLAKSYLAQSKTMAKEAERLKQQAYSLDPSLKPTRKTSTSKKSETTNEEIS